jgi:2-dehydro-3-deoxyglucarate aldolase/4-hydroxy-2-oxoheptanedioate aldolase
VYLLEKLEQKLKRSELISGANVVLSDSAISELYGFAGCDYVWIDMEHAALTHKDVEDHIIASHSGGAAAFVRIPWNDQVMAKRIIDMGPDGIIFPFIRTAQDAKDAVRACSYPPGGIRGWNPIRALKYGITDQNWYIKNADSLVWKILMIEHIDAVNNIEEILSVPGINAIIIGPSDLTGSMGYPLQTNIPEFWPLIKKVTDAAKAAGVVIGTAVPTNSSKELLFQWLQYGLQMISFGQDAFLLSAMVRENLENIGTVFKQYRNK